MAKASGHKKSSQETERSRYWRKQIRLWEGSGLTQTAFCAKRGLSFSAFGWWKSELKRREAFADEDGRKAEGGEVFVPVHVKPGGVPADAIEVSLPSGPVLRIPAGFDASDLVRLLEVLESRC